MLLFLTSLVDFGAMAITFWLALYLLGKSFPSRIAMRAVAMLLALSIFFFGAYYNLFHQVEGMAAWRATLLIIGLGTWYSLICQLVSPKTRYRFRWMEIGVYLLGLVTVVLLFTTENTFFDEQGNGLYVAHMGINLPYVLYGIFQLLVSILLLINLLAGEKIGLTSQGKYFLLASIFPILGAGYGILALGSPIPMSRIIPDFLTFSGVFLLGAAVARHQAFLERRITLPDFPISGLTMLGLSAIYALLAWRLGFPPGAIALVMMLSIFTHSVYDLSREFLERMRIHYDSTFRQKLHDLENDELTEQSLRLRLKLGLGLLCQTLKASGGFVATRRGDEFVVVASRKSVSLDSQISPAAVAAEDVVKTNSAQLPGVAWIAPVFEGKTQVAVVGLGKPRSRMEYSSEELDLLSEVADRLGTLVSLTNRQSHLTHPIQPLAAEAQTETSEMNSNTDEIVQAITVHPETEFIKFVEEGLRHLSDYIALGQSPLAVQLGTQGESQIERGKALYQTLMESIESLRPAGPRPREPLPRVWYSYVVLHDAYVESAPNREIMARLYISEGTFNRTRRNALRGLARLLWEKNQPLATGG
jgi:hypothetical protein